MKWPTVEDATRRINILIGDQAETDMAARDLIVLMRELGRVTAENVDLRRPLASEPASGDADTYADAFREAAITGQAFVKDGRLLKSEDVYAPPPPPTLGDVELWEPIRQVLLGRKEDTTAYHEFCAALRQRADEATRNENIGCAALVERLLQRTYPLDSAYEPIVAAIRARIAR